MNRAREFWNNRTMVVVRRVAVLLIRAFGWLAAMLLWMVRTVWARIRPRARIFVIIIGLVLISAWTGSALPSLSEAAYGFAVLILAFIGFWWIVTAPFPRRRWW